MRPTSENRTTPSEGKQPVRNRGCLITFSVIVLLILLGAIRIYHPPLKVSTPSGIEMRAWPREKHKEYKITITNPSDCSSVISAFKLGTLTTPCMCKYVANFEIRYDDGRVDDVDLLPGHAGPDSCEIRMGRLHYRLSRKDLIPIMNSAGIDSSNLPWIDANSMNAEQAAPGQPATRSISK